VKYVVAATREDMLGAWRRGLVDLRNVEFRLGYGTQVVGDSDAAVLPFEMAYDRYGGTPEIGRSKILRNNRNDGYPPLIIATPPFGSSKEVEKEEVLGDRLCFALSSCFMAAQAHNVVSRDAIESLFLHVEGAGLQRFPQDTAICAFRRAVMVCDAS
jgi:hypothetical protein